MPAQETDWTAEMVRALPDDGKRYEVLDGQLLVSPAPSATHQGVLKRLFIAVHLYVEAHRIGFAYFAPADLEFTPRRMLQPDLFVVPWREEGELSTWSEAGSLLLVAEVLSPSTARADRVLKRDAYLEERAGEYWIVDADARVVERWRPGDERPEIVKDVLTWQPVARVAPFSLELASLFARA